MIVAIYSMTGFARAGGQFKTYSWSWEVRSVNGKGLDMRLRVPSGFDALDANCRKLIGDKFKRGNISASLTLNRSEEQGTYRVNQDLLKQLIEAMYAIEGQVQGLQAASVDGLMRVRGVVEQVEEEESEEDLKALQKELEVSFETALKDLFENRKTEGARMGDVLFAHVDDIEKLSTEAIECEALQPEALRNRLVRQLKSVMADIPELDHDRISQEAALIMTKADIREELDRLIAHISAARDLLTKGSPCGRKLDFLCQEFNREANTLCSKSQDVELTRIGLELKSVIEQFREQVQNIE
jgi:uncharacterized protein (TIGR00255 family)